MRISYRWLCDLLPGLSVPPSVVAERLTLAGLEVEGQDEIGAGLDPIVVVEVRRVDRHPTRDKLSLATVHRGGGWEQRVVCGAPNVPAPGGLVLLAPLGTRLPGWHEPLTPREIGGIVSEGMLTSEVELGLGDDGDGIVVLPPGSCQPGTPLLVAIPTARDTVFEVAVPPNRGDALSHLGIARELGALMDLPFQMPEPQPPKQHATHDIRAFLTVDNEDPERCPEYGARVVVDVQVAPSPLWMRWRLRSLGIRPISNVVDITNWLLLEFGHPMHSFDLDRVRGRRIVIRRARSGEPFVTLDGVARVLDADDLVICDAEGPTALAGIMGGQDSEIRDDTKRVLLECAYFAPAGVRRTRRRQALSTDSSYRFERGVDWGGISRVLAHATAWLTEIASGKAAPGEILAGSRLPRLPHIELRQKRLEAVLGAPVPWTEAKGILGRLGFPVVAEREVAGSPVIEVLGSSYRSDVEREVDLIEEIGRVRGLDELPTVLPAVVPQPPRNSGLLERELGRLASGMGLREALPYAFVSTKELEIVHAPPPVVTLKNPHSEERSVMRTSLLPGLLEALVRARRRGERSIALFSTGAIFLSPVRTPRTSAARTRRPLLANDVGVLPEERPSFAALMAGTRPSYLARPEFDLYDAKGLAVELVERATGRGAEVHWVGHSPMTQHLHPRGAAEIVVNGQRAGLLGPLHPEVLDALDMEGSAQVVELDLGVLENVEKRTPAYRPIPKLPSVLRDISLEVPQGVLAAEVRRTIAVAAGELCELVELIDVFEGKPVPPGYRSLTFRLVYRDPMASADPAQARTLTDQEVDARHGKVVEAAQKIGARQRS